MNALGYRKRSIFIPSGYAVVTKSVTDKLKDSDNKKIEYQINSTLFLLFLAKLQSENLKDVLPKVFSNKETKYFDYAKRCLSIADELDKILYAHYYNLLDIGGEELTETINNIMYAMLQSVKVYYKDYKYRNYKLFRNECNLSEQDDKAKALTEAVMLSRVMHLAEKMTTDTHNSFLDKHPNIEFILVKEYIIRAAAISNEIVSILCKHITKKDDVLFPIPMQNYHKQFIGVLLDKDLFLSSCRSIGIS